MVKRQSFGNGFLAPRSAGRAPNSGSWLRYIVVVFIMLVGSIYAAPNLFLPDPAIRIKPQDTAYIVDEGVLSRVEQALQKGGVEVLGTELDEGTGLIRLKEPNDQHAARNTVQLLLNERERSYIVALDQGVPIQLPR